VSDAGLLAVSDAGLLAVSDAGSLAEHETPSNIKASKRAEVLLMVRERNLNPFPLSGFFVRPIDRAV